jgi:hypothetical protein
MSSTLASVWPCAFVVLKRRARAFGPSFGRRDLGAVIGWALAHHELHSGLCLASSLRVWRRRAGAFGQPFGLPDLPFFAWPKKGRPKKGHPSSAPFAHPCAKGPRESVDVRGQAVPGLSRTSAASLRPPLRAYPRTPAAPQGPREERGLLPAGATATATAKSHERRATSEEPRAKSHERRATSEEPKAKSQKRRAKSEEPKAKSQKRRAKSEERRARSEEPKAESHPALFSGARCLEEIGIRHPREEPVLAKAGTRAQGPCSGSERSALIRALRFSDHGRARRA